LWSALKRIKSEGDGDTEIRRPRYRGEEVLHSKSGKGFDPDIERANGRTATMKRIHGESHDPDRPYEHLLPLVNALVKRGNAVKPPGFSLRKEGWGCDLLLAIDTQFILSSFDLPDWVNVSPEFDTILDKKSWVAIEGPGAAEANRRALAERWAARSVDGPITQS
jgi:hypothetical protein